MARHGIATGHPCINNLCVTAWPWQPMALPKAVVVMSSVCHRIDMGYRDIAMDCRGNAMTCHAMVMPWHGHGKWRGLSWLFHGLSWQCHGSSMATDGDTMAPHGDTMHTPWECHGSA